MVFKPEPRNTGDLRNDWLKRKWGMTNPNTNSAFEANRKQILELVTPCWGNLKDKQKEYFEGVLKHQEKWDGIWQEEYSQ